MTTFATQATVALEEAIRYAEHGYALTPVTITREVSGKKKARFHRGWRHENAWSADPDQIRAWWVDHPDTSFAIGCAVNGIEGVDLDVKPAEGIDSVSWWAERSLPMGRLCQDTPSGGRHTIWAVRSDGRSLPQEAGKTLGRGIDTRNRSGLFFAAGAYVLGEPGNYTIAGGLPRRDQLTTTPDEVLALFAAAEKQERAERPADGRIVVHQLEWQQRMVAAALDAVQTHPKEEGGYRKKLQHAALFLGRVVEQGLLKQGEAMSMLTRAHMSVWGPAIWPENLKDIRDALTDGPALERWRAPEPMIETSAPAPSVDGTPDEVSDTPPVDESYHDDDPGGESVDGDELARRVFEREVAFEIRKQDIREAANRVRAERKRAGRPSIEDGVIDGDDLDSIEPPEMLMGSLIPEHAVGFLSGRSGAYKSFLAVSWACCIATGRPWLGDPQFAVRQPLKTLYVAAEGAAGAAGRIRAWKAQHHESLRGKLGLYPRPILLNDDGHAEELAAYVAKHGYEFLVVDTYRRATAGSEENSSAEFGVVFEAVARLRDDLGCGVMFIDHTGHSGDGRPVGAEAKIASSDYVLAAMYEGATRESSVQRELFVIKLKDEESSGRWPVVLRPIEGQKFPVVVVGEVEAAADDAFLRDDRKHWWETFPEIPECVARLTGKGSTVAIDIYRVLAYVGGVKGLTQAEVKTHLRRPDVKPPHPSVVSRALTLLKDQGITREGLTPSRVALREGLK